MQTLLSIDRRTRALIPYVALLLVAGIGAIDWLHGQHLNLTLAYLTPVALAALLPAPGFGVLVAASAAATAAGVALAGERLPWNLPVYAWNTVALFALGLFLVLLVAALRRALQEAQDAGRIDPVTGIADAGRFRELAATEMTRTARYQRPLTMACVDVAGFGATDAAVGDQWLRAVAQTIAGTLRKTDLVTRLDGNRFAVLLPETDQRAAQTAVNKMHERLGALAGTKRWPGIFSIGVVTCSHIPQTLDHLVEIATQVLHTAKADRPGTINFTAFDRCD